MALSKNEQRIKRHKRLRRKVVGTPERPRLQIQRTLHHTYATVVDDSKGHTLLAVSTRQKDLAEGLGSRTSIEAARKVGEAIGRKAKAAGINAVVFDTSGRHYHGRVAALADAARKAGLEF
jgi:large subunit ribosomal protein L18